MMQPEAKKNLLERIFVSFEKEQEKAFRDYYYEISLEQVRVALGLGLVLYALFGIADPARAPESLAWLWLYRFGIFVPVASTAFFLSFARLFRVLMTPVLTVVILLVGVGQSYMMALTPPDLTHDYLTGTVLVLFFAGSFSRLRFFWSTITGWIIVFSSLAVLLGQGDSDLAEVALHGSMLISAHLVAMGAAYFNERHARNSFKSTCELRSAHDHLIREMEERRQVESEKRESYALYRLLAENATDAIWTTDLTMRFTYVSPAIERLFGYSPEEYLARPLSEVLTPESMQKAGETLARQIELEGDPHADPDRAVVLEFENICKDGSIRWSEATIAFLRNDKGGLTGILGVTRDIHDRHKAEEALWKAKEELEQRVRERTEELVGSERRYRRLTENAQDLIARTELDGTLVYINPAIERMLGYTVEETLGKNIEELLTFESVQQIASWIRLVFRDDVSRRHFQGEVEYIHKEGHRVPCDCRLSIVRDQTENKVFLEGISRDITEQKQADLALRKSEERYRRLTEDATDMIWRTDKNGVVTYVNRAVERMLGYSVEEALGRSMNEYLTEESVEALSIKLRRMLQSPIRPDRFSCELEYIHRDKSIVPAEVKASIVRDEQLGLVAIDGITRDITERKKAEEEKTRLEEQLRQSQKMEAIGCLAGGVAHDFNNILTAIIGYSEMGIASIEPGNPIQNDLKEIRNAARRAAGLTQQLLAFSRKQIISPKVIKISDVVLSSKNMLQRIIGEDVELKYAPPPALWSIKVDPGQVDQVLVNLAANARDAMPEGGKLTIETINVSIDSEYCRTHSETRPGEFVLLSVSDSGCGMDAATRSRIFEPFFSTKEVGKGTGLGLSTVYGIVKQNQGFINVYSEVGIGTTFKVYFPRILVEYVIETRPRTARSVNGSETVLLVEDEEMLRILAKKILERKGYSVLEASNGEEALTLMKQRKEPIDLLLTDIVMPKMNGKELYSRLSGLLPGLRVIYMSGYTEEVVAHHGVLEEGANFVQKPFNIQEFTSKVREVLDSAV